MLFQKNLEQNYRAPSKDLLWILSAEGFILSASVGLAGVIGWNEDDLLGKPFHSLLHPDEIPRVKEGFSRISNGETIALNGVRCFVSGESFLIWDLSLIPDIQNGSLAQVLVLGGLNVNERSSPSDSHNVVRLYSEKEKGLVSEPLESLGLARLTESLLANAPLGCVLLDEELRVVCLNQTFAKLIGFSPEQQLGQPFKEIMPKAAQLILPQLISILTTGNSLTDLEFMLQGADAGLARHALMSFYPIPNGKGGNCGVALMAQDITDRKRSEERLKKISAALERSNRALEDFSSIASHDLREPLRTIAMFVKRLENKYRGSLDKETQDYIQYAVDGTERMKRLIEKILEYSTAGKVHAGFSEVDCSKLMKTILGNLEVSIEENNVQVTFESLPTLWGDEWLLLQVFQNLISNAIKYRSSISPKIHISVKKEKNDWVFSFADNGIGISPEEFSNIFAPFRKLHSQSDYAGSGLGLAICQKNVERHRGKIWVESQEGQGSTFFFTIPADPPKESLIHERA